MQDGIKHLLIDDSLKPGVLPWINKAILLIIFPAIYIHKAFSGKGILLPSNGIYSVPGPSVSLSQSLCRPFPWAAASLRATPQTAPCSTCSVMQKALKLLPDCLRASELFLAALLRGGEGIQSVA